MTALAEQRIGPGLGASEIAAAIGLSPWRTPLSVWLEKTGQAPPFDGNEYTEWGLLLEPAVRQKYATINRVTVHVPPRSLYHRDLLWCRATPDGIAVEEGPAGTDLRWKWPVQIKVSSFMMRDSWGPTGSATIPEQYLIQEVVEMAVTDLPRADVAVLIDGHDYRQYTIARDLELEREVLAAAADFWDRVQRGVPPEVDDTDDYRKYLGEKLRARDVVAPQSPTGDELATALYDARRVVADAIKERKQVENDLRSFLVESGADAINTGLGRITWRQSAGKASRDWESLARDYATMLQLSGERVDATVDIEKFTEYGKPSRTLRVPRNWGRDDKETE